MIHVTISPVRTSFCTNILAVPRSWLEEAGCSGLREVGDARHYRRTVPEMSRRRQSNSRLFESDGYSFKRWLTPTDVEELLPRGAIRLAVDPATGREIGYKLRDGRPWQSGRGRAEVQKRDFLISETTQDPPTAPGNSGRPKSRLVAADSFYVKHPFSYSRRGGIPLRAVPLGARGRGTRAAIINEPPKKPLGPWRMAPATEGLLT
jgi:hypothetical protein